MDPQLMEFGVVGLALIVIYRLLGIGQQVILSKKGLISTQAATPCQVDPMYVQRIVEIHQMTKDTEQKKAEGQFKCQFKGRDEVRDLLESIRTLTIAVERLTKTMNGNR